MARVEDKPLRADAQRNRDRLLEVAVAALADGAADVSLEAIAKEAGVGIGTLYRHFPTREALVEAVYRNELASLCDEAAVLAGKRPGDRALRAWLDRFVGYLTTKQGMGEALKAVIAGGSNPFAESRERLTAALATLLEAGAADGTLRNDVAAADALLSVSGAASVVVSSASKAQAGRVLDLVVDGLRHRG